MARNPARNPKVTRRTRTTSAGPAGSVRRTTPPPQSKSGTTRRSTAPGRGRRT